MVEAAIAIRRQALAHAVQHVRPDTLRAQLPGLHPGDGLDVGGDALFQPVAVFRNRRHRQMHHLMGHGPVVLELGRADLAAEADHDQRLAVVGIAPGGAAVDAIALHRLDHDIYLADWKAAEIGIHGEGGARRPGADLRLADRVRRGVEGQQDLTAADAQAGAGETAGFKLLADTGQRRCRRSGAGSGIGLSRQADTDGSQCTAEEYAHGSRIHGSQERGRILGQSEGLEVPAYGASFELRVRALTAR